MSRAAMVDNHGHVSLAKIWKVFGDSTKKKDTHAPLWARLYTTGICVCVEAGVSGTQIYNPQQDRHAPPLRQPSTTTSTPHATATARILSIRLIIASGVSASSSKASASVARVLEESWDAVAPAQSVPVFRHSPSLIALKTKALGDPTAGAGAGVGGKAQRKLVPKKSKLSILNMGMELGSTRGRKSEEGVKDLSDVVRRVGLSESGLINDTSCTYACATGWKAGFEIYVDPSHADPDAGEIAPVKSSRVALDGVRVWEGRWAMS
ncbi:hypothetical protein CVT25_005445 [Psilocybe cyanescens]|uniref:Uncharacterized protein n=1 Tax=Psilocybe cyanescens TaxID=93625 RepID=A0A409XBY1_PSICY|nr:hypothetical protein CVT25_005445 [Psilocybe cyanescens]